jgi:GNAT superfamily N-acetyltransferase
MVPRTAPGLARRGAAVENPPMAPTPVVIRTARRDELVAVQEIEVAAGALFAEVGMAYVPEDPPPSIDELERYRRRETVWVAADELTDRPMAYLLADLVDGNAHIEQVSVHPGWGRQGIGRALIDHLEEWAAGEGLPAVTLTTFVDVLWNGPYYLRCGFRPMAESELGPGLAALRASERARGLDRHARQAMIKTLTGEVS